MPASSLNLITDIAGIRVGHADRGELVSGVTVITIDRPNRTISRITGGAPGTRGALILGPDTVNDDADAIVLSGGSAFGLDAAGGVMDVLQACGVGFEIGGLHVPIVAQAITFDLLSGGATARQAARGEPIYWHLGAEAARAAVRNNPSEPFALGSVGGGMGATTATAKGGIGSASQISANGYTVGAIAVVNAIGSALIGDGPHFWAAPYEQHNEFGGRAWPEAMSGEDLALRTKGGSTTATTIALVATDASLTKAQLNRLAIMADDGLARAIRPTHAPMDGDTLFATSVAPSPTEARAVDPNGLTALGAAASDCLARAVARGVYEAGVPGPSYQGPGAYADLFGRGDGTQ